MVEAVGDAVQKKKKTPSDVRGRQVDTQAGKCSAGEDDVVKSNREITAQVACERSGARGRDTVMKMLAMDIVGESGVQTKYIRSKKLRKFLRIKTKKIDEPDFMVVMSNETIKHVARSLQRRDEPDNVGSAKAQRYLETDWDTFRENSAIDLLTPYFPELFRRVIFCAIPYTTI
ncbi:hypothetical protein ON010_g18100 [Phytophthora cinnamomi]|nr:hypothetical protein ON010_g18100 [Phytophthora cinnamomi]